MSTPTVKQTECKDSMNHLERSLRGLFWKAVAGIFTTSCVVGAGYWKIQETKINKIAVQSIRADERLEKRLESNEARQIIIERQQAAMSAKMDANMKWLMDSCSRIETKQARIAERLDNRQP